MGNANSGRREQPFLEALRMELKEAGKDMPRLRNIAKQLIDKAETGDMQAITEFANRLDGRPRQQLEVSGDADNPVVIKRVVIDGADTSH